MNKLSFFATGMRKSISSLLILLLLVLIAETAYSERVIKLFLKAGPKDYNWEYRLLDEWGGENSWCILPGGDECCHYSWKAVYFVENDPCPQNNNAAYGEACISQEAMISGIELPEGLLPVTFVLITE